MISHHNKIYECFTFFNELELLELRLKIMSEFVDQFVLVEATKTFTGLPKRLFFEENKDKFSKYNIKHIIVDDLPFDNATKNYNMAKGNEIFQRECMLRGLRDCKPDDVIIITDIDEITDMNVVINNLYRLDNSISFALEIKLFYFYVNYYSGEITGPVICKYKNLTSVQKYRAKRFRRVIKNGGWHYSYLGGTENIKEKIKSYAMTELNNDNYVNDNHIELCLKTGKDLFGRRHMNCKVVDLDGNSPNYINKFVEKYPHLIKLS